MTAAGRGSAARRFMAHRALAADVILLASRRRLLWLYLLLGTTIAGLVPGILRMRGEQQRPAPPLLAGELALPAPGRVVPGTLRVTSPGVVHLQEDGSGQLLDAQGAVVGRLDAERGVLVLEREVASVGSATLGWQVDVESRAGRQAAADPDLLVVDSAIGVEFKSHDNTAETVRATADQALPTYALNALYQLLVAIAVAVFGVGLGLVAVADAVTSAFRPGTAPLVLARPVCRSDVILARFAGGLLFGAIQLSWILLVSSAVMWVKFELFPVRLLAAAAPLLLKFALLLAIATAVGVVLRSVVLGLVGAAGSWIVSFTIAMAGSSPDVQANIGAARGPMGLSRLLEWLVVVWPPITVQDEVASGLCVGDDSPELWWRMLWIVGRGLVWTAALLGLTFLAVRRRDC